MDLIDKGVWYGTIISNTCFYGRSFSWIWHNKSYCLKIRRNTSMEISTFDLEGHLFKPGYMAPKPICLSYADSRKSGILVGLKDIEEYLHYELQYALNGNVIIANHCIAFDFCCILEHIPSLSDLIWRAYSEDRIVCTMEREKLLDISIGEFGIHIDENGAKRKHKYNLGDLLKRNLDLEVDKSTDSWRLKYSELEHIPLTDWPEKAIEYSIDDSVGALALYHDQERRMDLYNYNIPTQFNDSRASFALKLMSVWGIETDYHRVSDLWGYVIKEMNKLLPDILDISSVNIKPKNVVVGRTQVPAVSIKNKTIMDLVEGSWDHFKNGPIPTTATGRISIAGEVLEKCDSEKLQTLVEFRKLQKKANTYIRKLFSPVIHSNFQAVGAVSHRTSCSDINLQNQPKLVGFRECFKARKGCVLVSCDYDAQEVRTFAQTCFDLFGHSKLKDQFNEDRHYDPHLDFAATMLQISFGEAKIRYKEGDPLVEATRQQAKIGIFGFFGGMGVDTFVKYAEGWGLFISPQRGAEIKAALWQHLPEISLYMNNIQNLLGGSVLEIPRTGFRRGDAGYCDMANGYFQGLAADITKSACFDVAKLCYNKPTSHLYRSRPVAAIHDELLVESKKAIAHLAAKELESTMISTMERRTPDIPAAASASMMHNWIKDAKAVYKDGILIPWEDREL